MEAQNACIKDEIKSYRNEIREIASRIVMSFDGYSQDVDLGSQYEYIGRAVKAARCNLITENSTILNVMFQKGGFLGKHSHKAQRKIVHVIEGTLRDFVNDVNLKEGDVYTIEKGKEHGFVSDNALLTIRFIPPSESVSILVNVK